MRSPKKVIVIGAGIAGLTAAFELGERGHAVTVLESGDCPGGRLVPPQPDGGVGLSGLIPGWHQRTLDLCRRVGAESQIAWPRSLRWEFQTDRRPTVRLPSVPLPRPLDMMAGIALFRAWTERDRMRLMAWLERTWEGDPPLPADLDTRPAADWVAGLAQSEHARAAVWSPLCRFVTGESLETVSAAILVDCLRRAFLSGPRARRLGLPASSSGRLSDVLVPPLLRRLQARGVTIQVRSHVGLLRFNGHRVVGLQLQSGEDLTADAYVAAVPHRALTPLLPERAVTRFSYFQQLERLADAPAVAVTMRVQVEAPARLVLLKDGPFDWALCAPHETGTARITMVATGRPDVLATTDKDLSRHAAERRAVFGPLVAQAPITHTAVVREPAAFLSARPGVSALRPLQQSPFSNFLLAGDWTDTGLPATVESAIVSAERCAAALDAR